MLRWRKHKPGSEMWEKLINRGMVNVSATTWWHLHLQIFSSVFLFHQHIFSCLNPARIHHPKHWEQLTWPCSCPHPPQCFFILPHSANKRGENNSPLSHRDWSSTTIPQHSGRSWAGFVQTSCSPKNQSWSDDAWLMSVWWPRGANETWPC